MKGEWSSVSLCLCGWVGGSQVTMDTRGGVWASGTPGPAPGMWVVGTAVSRSSLVPRDGDLMGEETRLPLPEPVAGLGGDLLLGRAWV